ncbi:hypothetical protein LLG96_19320 [bacterium]|nr:hypothetical protein [bacterium]
MKKIFIFMAPVLLLAIMYGCSKDHSSPTFSLYDSTSSPVNVLATYDKGGDLIKVSWSMENTEDVANYLVAWSDSNVFDYGKTYDQFVKLPEDVSLKTEISLDTNDVLKKMEYYKAADIDSFIVYFTVSAVYNNKDFNYFIGPRAEVDSVLILR